MTINSNTQVSLSDLKRLKANVLLCSSGYEARSTYLATQLELTKIPTKIVFAFNNEVKSFNRKINDNFYEVHGFRLIVADSDADSDILKCLKEIILFDSFELNIIIDYSSMSRIWYAAILRFFYYNSDIIRGVNLYFSYSTAKFSPSPKEQVHNLHVGPIRGFSNLTIPQKPTALIIGLGYEKSRALGLNEYLDGETFIFYSYDLKHREFSDEVEKNNASLLSQFKNDHICRYSIYDINGLYSVLFSLCRDLSDSYRVILASCGPKTFTLASLSVALELEIIDVWRISAGKGAIPTDKIHDGELVIFKTTFGQDISGKI